MNVGDIVHVSTNELVWRYSANNRFIDDFVGMAAPHDLFVIIEVLDRGYVTDPMICVCGFVTGWSYSVPWVKA